MSETTKIIEMSKFLEEKQETVMLGSSECNRSIQVQFLCKHGRTMCMMYQATGEQRYLDQARLDLDKAKEIQAGFIRPLGVLLAS